MRICFLTPNFKLLDLQLWFLIMFKTVTKYICLDVFQTLKATTYNLNFDLMKIPST